VRDLVDRLGMIAPVLDGPPAERPRSFRPNQYAEFAAVVTREIAQKWALWIAQFGTTLAVTRKELYEKIILPLYEPPGTR
jgi:hypothetical protein